MAGKNPGVFTLSIDIPFQPEQNCHKSRDSSTNVNYNSYGKTWSTSYFYSRSRCFLKDDEPDIEFI